MSISTYDANSLTPSSVGTEQTIKSVNVIGEFSLKLDLNNMVSGDWTIINVYQIVKTGGTSRLIKSYSFAGVPQTILAWESDRFRNDLTDTDSLIFKINQYLGTARAYPWAVMRDSDAEVLAGQATIAGYIDTEVAAIKTQTDKMVFTITNQLDVNVLDWKSATAPAMTGDAFARLGAPAGASVSADVASIKTDTGTTIPGRLPAALVGGRMSSDVGSIGGVVQSMTDLKDFADTGYDPATHKVAEVVLTDTTTTLTNAAPDSSGITTLLSRIASALNISSGVVEANLKQVNGSTVSPAVIDSFFAAFLIGTAQAGAASSLTLSTAAIATTNYYTGWTLILTGGTGAGQARLIGSYNTSRIATVVPNWSTNPDNTTTYVCVPLGQADIELFKKLAPNSLVNSDLPASVTQWAGTAVATPAVAGVPVVDMKYIFGSVLSQVNNLAASFKKFFDIATPAATMDHGVLTDTTTQVTNAPPGSMINL